jgi:hypothetical protein
MIRNSNNVHGCLYSVALYGQRGEGALLEHDPASEPSKEEGETQDRGAARAPSKDEILAWSGARCVFRAT